MKRRTAVLAVALAAVIAGFTVSVAQALPAPPDVTNLDAATTAGHVTGTVTSDQPDVLVRLSAGSPWTVLDTSNSQTPSFDLATWGFGAGSTVHAVACPTATFDETACSAEQTSGVGFDATDADPGILWFTDDTVGPTQTATVTANDTGHGGTLQAVWDNTEGSPLITPLNQSGPTDLSLVDGTGLVTIQRCSTVDISICTGFTPAITHSLTVRTTASASLGSVADITTANPNTSGTVTTNRTGTYSVSWHLEQSGTPVTGTDGTDTGTLDGSGAAVITIPGTGLADGSYDIKGTITVTDPSFGEFPAAAFSGTVNVDSTGAPLITNLDDTVPGHVTGTLSSLRPDVYVWFDGSKPAQLVALSGGSGSFDLPTWGYAGPQTLHAVACPAATQDNTCTAEQTAPFIPTDVAPTVTWAGTSSFTAKNLGAPPAAAVTVDDPGGGGTLQAVWDNTPAGTKITPLNPSGDTSLLNLVDGTGTVRIQRCSADGSVCTDFSPEISTTLTVDTTAPVLTSITSSHSTIYPLASTRPGSTLLSAVGSGASDVTKLRLTGPSVIDLQTNGSGQVTWYGRPTGARTGALAPAGTYTVTAYDAFGNASTAHATVVLSSKRLVLKTFRRTITARGSLLSQYVGACSVLRKPSLRGWVGSLGFYSDTRCNATGWSRSAVSTVNTLKLPAAEKYLDVHVDTYGGAARAVPGSAAIVRYLTTGSVWVAQKTLGHTLTTHVGQLHSLAGLVFGDRSFGWGVATGFGNRYDVKNFTVVVRYYVLG